MAARNPTPHEDETRDQAAGAAVEEHSVAAGRAPETPFVMIAAVATVVGVLVALALLVVVVAVWLT